MKTLRERICSRFDEIVAEEMTSIIEGDDAVPIDEVLERIALELACDPVEVLACLEVYVELEERTIH